MLQIVLLHFLQITSEAFLFGSGGCGGCCRSAACQPPPLPPPHQPSCYPQQPQQNSYYQQPHQQMFVPIPRNGVGYVQPKRNGKYLPNEQKDFSENDLDVFGSLKESTFIPKKTNIIDDDAKALENFESTLQTYKMLTKPETIRRSQQNHLEMDSGELRKCSSQTLKIIIQKAMQSHTISAVKLQIAQKAKKVFGYNFDVICSETDFSYLISSNIHCRVELDGQICLAYEN